MKETLVMDIMVPLEEYPLLTDKYTLRQAIEEMGKAEITSKQKASLPRVALVFDQDFRELLGLLRRRDIMRGLEPRFLISGSLEHQRKLFNVEIDPNLTELSYDKILAHINKRANRLVGEFMIPIKATIRHDDHIMKAIYEMVQQNTSLLPVLKHDDVVGVLRSVDVLNTIALMLRI